MDNLKITKLDLDNYACFEKASIDFGASPSSAHQWTVFLGNNNTGKTNILKAIAQLRPQELKLPVNKDGHNEKFIPSAFFDLPFQTNLRPDASVNSTLSDGEKWFYKRGSFKISNKPLDSQLLIFGYGVSRYPSSTSLSENKAKPCETLFSTDSRLVNLEEWLMQLDYAAKNDKTKANNKLYRIKELICGNLFPEIQDFTFQSSDDLHNYVLFTTKDGAFRYTQLGYGYQSMLSWIVDLCKRMFDAYPDLENPLEGGAIVLVDEIDLHLHPKWQREIISYLSEAFPNVQFIVTTHSPLVVQSANDINLYVLKRDENEVNIEKAPRSNYSGSTVEEILRETMELESDVHSDIYNNLLAQFNKGLDNGDKAAVEEAYRRLDQILHPNNPVRRLLELQKDTM